MKAALSLALLISVLGAKAVVKARQASLLKSDKANENAAMERLERLASFDDLRLEKMRAKAARFRVQLGGAGTPEAVARCLGTRWARRSSESSNREGYVTRTENFAMISPSAADWPLIVSTIEAIEKIPGTVVREIDLKSSESALDQVSMVLAVEVMAGTEKTVSK